jgi:hypothetical protein
MMLIGLGLVVFMSSACTEAEDGTPRTSAAGSARADDLREAIALPEGPERVTLLARAVGEMELDSAHLLADVIQGSGEQIPFYEQRVVYLGWAEIDGGEAFRNVLALPPEARRSRLAAVVIRRLAEIDPVQARVLLSSLAKSESEELGGSLLVAFVEGWAVGGHGLAPISNLLEKVPKGWNRERATRVVIDVLLERDEASEAMAWAESIPVGGGDNYRAVAFRKIALVVGEQRPRQVADWLEPHRAFRYGQAGFRVLARTWGQYDPTAAIEWALDQIDDRARFLAIKFSFDSWFQKDEAAARAWLKTQSDVPALDPVYMMVALRSGATDPHGAAEAAAKIDDDRSRLDALARVLGPWLDTEPTNAAKWLQSSRDSEAVRDRIRAIGNSETERPRSLEVKDERAEASS